MTDARTRWVPVTNYEFRYEVSSLGRVRRVSTQRGTHAGRMLSGSVGYSGHPTVDLWREGKRKSVRVCELVARAFRGPRPAGSRIAFRDGKPSNVAASNVAYRKPTRSRK